MAKVTHKAPKKGNKKFTAGAGSGVGRLQKEDRYEAKRGVKDKEGK